MPDIELVNMLRDVIHEELKPVTERLTALEAGQEDLKKGQAAIGAVVNDLRAINRRTHKEIFTQLNSMWEDIKLLSAEKEKAIR